jgi:hypothetical protein
MYSEKDGKNIFFEKDGIMNEEGEKTDDSNLNLDGLKEKLKDKDKMNQYIKNGKCSVCFELLDYVGSGSESVIYGISMTNRKNPQQKKKCNYEINLIKEKK